MKEISDFIDLERIEIIEETPDFYRVKYGNDEYEIAKDSESHFCLSTYNEPNSLSIQPQLDQILVSDTTIFQDERVIPKEFKEIMMFHEIREKEYREKGFDEEAHRRVMNDEILYLMKFFDKETTENYLQFSEAYRVSPTLGLNLSRYFVLKKDIEKGEIDYGALQEFYYENITNTESNMKMAKELIKISKVELDEKVKDRIWDNLLEQILSFRQNVSYLTEFKELFNALPKEDKVLNCYDRMNHLMMPYVFEMKELYELTGVSPTREQIEKQREKVRSLKTYFSKMNLSSSGYQKILNRLEKEIYGKKRV